MYPEPAGWRWRPLCYGRAPPTTNRLREERLTFFSALAEFFWIASHRLAAIVLDDGHHIDPASIEAIVYIHGHCPPIPERPVFLHSFRPEELNAVAHAAVRAHVERGAGTLVELQPLLEHDVRSLLESMGPYGLGAVAGEMTRYTGGNPLFVVETAKYLIESGNFDGAFPAALRPPGRIQPIIEQRLARLSPEAAAVARLVAVAQTEVDPAQVAGALGLGPLQLIDAWRELEAAHIFRGRWFAHELIAETVLSAMPEATRSAAFALVSATLPAHLVGAT